MSKDLETEMREFITVATAFIETSKVRFHTIEQVQDEHKRELYGVNAQTPGIKTKVDRMEQKEEGRTWIVRTLLAIVAGLGLERLHEWARSVGH